MAGNGTIGIPIVETKEGANGGTWVIESLALECAGGSGVTLPMTWVRLFRGSRHYDENSGRQAIQRLLPYNTKPALRLI